jgi:hypothetical protein
MRNLLNGSSSAVCRRCNSRNGANLTPRQEQVGSWCVPAGTGPGSTQSWYGHRRRHWRNRYAGTWHSAKSNRHNPGKTEERSERPRQGGKKN